MAVTADPTTRIITVTAADGHRFDATACTPATISARLIFLSALGTPARVYGRLARELTASGIETILPDWRGIGSSSLRASRQHNYGYRHLLEHDLPAVIDAVAYDEAPVWVGGHSLGGQLALLTLAIQHTQLQGAILIASGSVHLGAYPLPLQRKIRFLLGINALCGPLLGYFPGNRVGFASREARGVMGDWGHVARTGRYVPAGSSIDYETALTHLQRPVLALNFAADAWSPHTAAHALLDKIGTAEKRVDVLGAADTGGNALDHFSWIKQPALIAPRLVEFIRSKTLNSLPEPS